MNDLVIQPGERILRHDEATWIKSWLRKPRGVLQFTTHRLVFEIPTVRALTASQGLSNELTNHVPVEIPRDALDGVAVGQHRKIGNVLVVSTEDQTFKFLVQTPVTEWHALLRQAMHDDKIALEHLLARVKPKDVPPPYR